MLRPELRDTLRLPGFRWLLLQSFGNSIGWQAEAIATGWLVLQITDSPFWLGAIAGIRGLTQLTFSIVGGAIADRTELRRFLARNQRYNCLLFVVVAVLVMTGAVQLWQIMAVQIVAGFLQAMNAPANQVLLFETVGPSRMLNARAVSFLVMSLTRILSALICGAIMQAVGIGPAYLFVSSGYLLGSLALRGVRPTAARPSSGAAARSLLHGLTYAMRTERVREVLVLSLIVESFGFSHMQLVPVIARDVLDVGASGLGYLAAASGAGQLVATFALASVGNVVRKHVLLLSSTAAYGVAIVLFALSPWFAASLILSVAIGAAGGLYDSTISAVLPMIVRADMRGRMVGLYTATWGSNQVGSFGLGILATLVGTPVAMASFAAVVSLTALRLVPRRALIDPRVAAPDGDQPAAPSAASSGP